MVSLKKQLFIVFSILQISSLTLTSQNSQPSSKENSPREKTFFPCVDAADRAAQEEQLQTIITAAIVACESLQPEDYNLEADRARQGLKAQHDLELFKNLPKRVAVPTSRPNQLKNAEPNKLLFTQEDIDNAVAKKLTERPEQFTQKNLDDAVSQALSLKEFAYTLQANHDRQARQQQIKRERVFFGATLFAISAYLFSNTDCCKNNVSKPITGKIVNPCKNLMAELFNNPKAFIPSFLKASSAQIAPANPK
ncbi:MAG: hypothetical protein NTU89_02895 [Candidatus Dependentiae bacterium]|nr:hypothetical protein [Candidatus Dependentiae bacterium]